MEGIGGNAPPGRKKERNWGYEMEGIGGNTPPEGRKRRNWGCGMEKTREKYTSNRSL